MSAENVTVVVLPSEKDAGAAVSDEIVAACAARCTAKTAPI